MLFWLALLISTGVFWLIRRWQYFSHWDHIPGPKANTSIPMLGHIYKLIGCPIEVLDKHRKEFGEIFRLDSGPRPTVYLCDYDTISKAMKKDILQGRPHHKIPGFVVSVGIDGTGNSLKGIVLAHGQTWAEQRKFLGLHLTTKKHTYDNVIGQEAELFCNKLALRVANGKQSVKLNGIFMEVVNRIVWRTITGHTIDDPAKMVELAATIREIFRGMERARLSVLIQMGSYWGGYAAQALGLQNLHDVPKPIHNFLESEIDKSVPDKDGNYLEKYLSEMQTVSKYSSFFGVMGKANLHQSLMDVFSAGTDTVSAYLEWFTVYMMAFPDVQEKCFREIEAVIGQRSARLEDRGKMHYLEATIHEIMRHSPHMALTVQHETLEETQIGGYHMPKNTQVYYYSWAVHHTESLFPQHEVFKPERFLDAEGVFHPDEHVIYFGIGKRLCLGKTLGKAECYLLSIALIQAFKFAPVDGIRTDLGYVPGLNMHVKDMDVKVVPRY